MSQSKLRVIHSGEKEMEKLLTPVQAQQQLLMKLPKVVQGVSKKVTEIKELSEEQLNLIKERQEVGKQQVVLLDRLFDRIGALIQEQRVTNMLLSELVALQRVVIPDDVRHESDVTRLNAYHRVLNGE